MVSDFDILTGEQYYDELAQRFSQASKGSRILLQSMSFAPDESKIEPILHELAGAVERGAATTFLVDSISFMYHNGQFGPLWYGRNISTRSAQVFTHKRRWIEKLQAFPNAKVAVMNRPDHRFSLHVAGRTHIKAAVIDDDVYIPTANLADQEFINIAVKFHDKPTADWLVAMAQTCADAGSMRRGLNGTDIVHRIDDTNTLYLDAGVRNQSIILDKALKLIDNANEWLTITCQYFPGGVTGSRLLDASRHGIDVKMIFSPPAHHHQPVKLMNQFNLALARSRLPASMFTHVVPANLTKMHIKANASDAGTLVGSHNYVDFGVRLGTAEIALHSTDPSLALKVAQKTGEQLVQQ